MKCAIFDQMNRRLKNAQTNTWKRQNDELHGVMRHKLRAQSWSERVLDLIEDACDGLLARLAS